MAVQASTSPNKAEACGRSSRCRNLIVMVGVLVLCGINVYYLTAAQSPKWVAGRFHEHFYNSQETWKKNKWLGIDTWQNPNDVWITQEIIAEIKPDFIIEAGTYRGGSAAIWAMVLSQVNPQGRVITMDIEDLTADARKLPIFQERVDFLLGSSTDPKIVGEIEKRVQGKKVMVLLDSDHSKAHVLNELKAYSKLVPVGSYLIVQDTNINGHPIWLNNSQAGPGPYEAVEEFLASTDQFQPDPNRERLLFTMHPKGYLKRVK
jgi:cephalosporin hydroxylase